MRSKELQEIILKISEGLLSSTTDLILYLFFLTGASFFKSPTSRGVYEAFGEADDALKEINYQTFKQALLRLKRSGYLSQKSKITANGRKKLQTVFPHYQKERTWDKRIFLVTYDIPTAHNRDRDLLRNYLKRIGCALLQESVWVTPYNPQEILTDFAKEKDLDGTILVSNLGLDGKIGDEDLRTLIKRVYKLNKVNEEYEKFIKQYANKEKFSRVEISFDFYSILSRDPQLPFDLLPEDWLGGKAYLLYLERCNI